MSSVRKSRVATAAKSSAEITRTEVAWALAASGTARQRNSTISAGVKGGKGDCNFPLPQQINCDEGLGGCPAGCQTAVPTECTSGCGALVKLSLESDLSAEFAAKYISPMYLSWFCCWLFFTCEFNLRSSTMKGQYSWTN